MNARQMSKEKTRNVILDNTALLFDKVGFLNLSSKEIAISSRVSQGTIFLHFKTKEKLLNIVLIDKINMIESKINLSCKIDSTQHKFIKNYLDIYLDNENILSRIYKDYSYLPNIVKKRLTLYEVNLKNLFFDNLKNSSMAKINIIDSFIAIESFFSQIQRNFIEKDFSNSISVMKQKRGRLLKLYKILFG